MSAGPTPRLAGAITVIAAAAALAGCGGGASGTSASTQATTSAARHGMCPGSCWIPGAGAPIAWQWELAHPLSLSSATDMGTSSTTYAGAPAPAPTVYDIDGFDTPASTVAALHARGGHVICYVDAGTWENWRPDAKQFPSSLLGRTNGWAGERWLDVRPSGPAFATLQRLITARMQMCADKGFDAVEADNIDASKNTTGFPVSEADSVAYANWLAGTAHRLGLSIAQKNFFSQAPTLVGHFDFALSEQCFEGGGCDQLAPYRTAGKAVLDAEYAADPTRYCPSANAQNINAVRFDTELNGATRVPCR